MEGASSPTAFGYQTANLQLAELPTVLALLSLFSNLLFSQANSSAVATFAFSAARVAELVDALDLKSSSQY